MIKVQYIPTSNKTYISYINKYKTDRLSKFLKIYTFEKFNENIIFESFDKLYNNTKYNIESFNFDLRYSNYNINGYKIWFETDSKNKYRIDLIPLKNFNPEIKNDFVFNISFTLDKYEVYDDEYEELTGLGEEKEVLLRIGNILSHVNLPKYFVIGKTELEKKFKIYKKILIYVFKDYNTNMTYCEGLKDNIGLYIWKNNEYIMKKNSRTY